ncbi:hypothetical protein WJX77_004408 [Trebouxia sp. C0004]
MSDCCTTCTFEKLRVSETSEEEELPRPIFCSPRDTCSSFLLETVCSKQHPQQALVSGPRPSRRRAG